MQLGGYTDVCGLDEDYTIEVFHAEGADQSVIRNPLNGESWPQPQHVIWQVTARGLQRLTTNYPPHHSVFGRCEITLSDGGFA